MGRPERIPIAPADGLHLERHGHAGADEPKFAYHFAKLWKSLPDAIRGAVVRHWVKSGGPVVQLLNGWRFEPDRIIVEWNPDRPQPFAVCAKGGCLLRFHAPPITVMPGHLLRALIGHEMAHVYQYAQGFKERFGTHDHPPVAQVEADANELAASWGCHVCELDAWHAEKWGETKLSSGVGQQAYDKEHAMSYDWTAGTTQSGKLKAIGDGQHAGKTLYGEAAAAALRGRKKGRDDEPAGRKPAAQPPTAQRAGTAPQPDKKAQKAAKQAAGHAAALKAITDPESLTAEEFDALSWHLVSLPVVQLKKLAASIKKSVTGAKAELARDLRSYVKTKRWAAGKDDAKPSPDSKHVKDVIAGSERAQKAYSATKAAIDRYTDALGDFQKSLNVLNPQVDKLMSMRDKLISEHGVDPKTNEGAADPRAADYEKYRKGTVIPAREATIKLREARDAAQQGIREAMMESLKPATPQKLNVTFEPKAHGAWSHELPTDFKMLDSGEEAKAKPVFDAATEFIQSVASGMDGAKITYGASKEGRAWAAKNGYHYQAPGGQYVALISRVPEAEHEHHGQTATAVHELGHVIEFHKPGVKELAGRFLDYRCKGEPMKKMSEVSPGAKYRDNEVGRKDNFDKVFGESSAYYVGKAYVGGDTEVVSMGLEQMFKDPTEFATKDPEYFQFICHVLTM